MSLRSDAGSVYLLRPDQHVYARCRYFSVDAVRTTAARATSKNVAKLFPFEIERQVELACLPTIASD